jgi:hypothetical protein
MMSEPEGKKSAGREQHITYDSRHRGRRCRRVHGVAVCQAKHVLVGTVAYS